MIPDNYTHPINNVKINDYVRIKFGDGKEIIGDYLGKEFIHPGGTFFWVVRDDEGNTHKISRMDMDTKIDKLAWSE